jgi:DNA-binding response OmpR family regulator
MENDNQSQILYVDDNITNLRLIESILKKEGYEVTLLQSGKAALDYLNEHKPDLILLDIMMPEMSGLEVCEKIVENKLTTRIPILFLTARSDRDTMLKGLQKGGVDYITKPINRQELLARVNTHLRLKKAHDEINKLKGLLPICSYCKKIRTEDGYWKEVEQYVSERSETEFSHGICQDCAKKIFPESYSRIENKSQEKTDRKEKEKN